MHNPASRSPVTSEVAGELRRIQERWRTLPLDRADDKSQIVRLAAQELVDALAESRSRPSDGLPDLGPGTAMDQLTVLVYDASEAEVAGDLAMRLAALRRQIG